MSLPVSPSPFPLRVTRTVARVLGVALVTVAFTACATPTEPVAEAELEAPKRNLICVGRGANNELVLVQPMNGECPAGFDLQPWW